MARLVGFSGLQADRIEAMLASFRVQRAGTHAHKLATDVHGRYSAVGRLDASPEGRLVDASECLVTSAGRVFAISGVPFDCSEPIEAVVAAGFRERGPAFFRTLEGDLSVILYDKSTDTLYLVRDRFGSNQLFHTRFGDAVVAASEIKAILAATGQSPVPDRTTIWRYLFGHYRYAYGTEDTFFEGIRLLAPNTILGLRRGVVVHRDTIWDYELGESRPLLEDADAIAQFHELLERSLDRREADLTAAPAYFLSGGLDSPTVAALAAKRRSTPITAFTIGYDDELAPSVELAYDERPVVKTIVDHHAMQWCSVIPRAADFEAVFAEMLERHDEPISSPTWFAHYQLVRAVRDAGFTVAFGGDGGDHALAGLYDDYPYYFADLHHAGDHARLDYELAKWQELHDHPAFPKNRAVWESYKARCFDWEQPGTITGYTWDEERMRGARGYESVAHPALQSAASLPQFPSHTGRYLISKLVQDLLYASSPPSSRAEDINLETFGVELRSAMLDLDFIKFCWSLPGHLMIRHGLSKYLIRIAMKGLLPDGVLFRREHVGLNAPFNVWVRGPLRGLYERTVASDVWQRTAFLDPAKLRAIYYEHVSQRANHMMFLWRVFSLEQWLRKIGAA